MKKFTAIGVIAVLAVAVTACGGGGGGATTTPVAASSVLTGVAATGAAMGNAQVDVSNAAGTSPCVETSITTSSLGSYTCTLKAGQSAPFFIVVTDPTGNSAPLVSIATQTPVAGTPLTVNATPLTTAIVAQLNNGDALGVVTNKNLYVAADFVAIKANVIAQLKPVTDAIGASNYDPFSTSITAATAGQTGNTADHVLDVIKVVTDSNGKPALATVTDPTPIVLATTTAATGTVAAISAGASDLSLAAQISAKAFTNCFALPLAQRVLSTDKSIPPSAGGWEVNSVGSACDEIVTNGSNANGALKFRHNGFSAGQFFYGMLTNDDNTGAVFSVPEIMAFYPKDANNANDRAVLNIRFVDSKGNPGNVITVAANIPGTSTATRGTDWWLTGNQQDVDVAVKTIIRRQEQLGANAAAKGPNSHFRSGMNIFVNANGPNSALYDSALVTGPGLPASGLWFGRRTGASSFILADQRSTAPVVYSNFTDSCGFCYNYWMARTVGLTGVDAATHRPNPVNWNFSQGTGIPRIGYTNSVSGLTPTSNYPAENSYDGASGTRPKKGDLYTIALYLTTNGTPTLYKTVKKTLLTDLIDPVNGINMKWNTAGSQTLAALDPTSLAVASIALNWNQTAGAEQIRSVTISMTDNNDDNTSGIPKGATSVTATAPTGKLFTGIAGALVTAGNLTQNGYRDIYFGYRMLDGTGKQSVYSYYP
jgi:hypothetical protein